MTLSVRARRLSLWLVRCTAASLVLLVGAQLTAWLDRGGGGLRVESFLGTDFRSVPLRTGVVSAPSTAGILEAWSGPPPDGTALDWEGGLAVLRPGRYTFTLTSDDGSSLYIDNKLVVDDSGIHEPRAAAGDVLLQSGIHPFAVRYTQGTGGYGLNLTWARDASTPSAVPVWALRRHGTDSFLRALPGVLAAALWTPLLWVSACLGAATLLVTVGGMLLTLEQWRRACWLLVPAWMMSVAVYFTARLYSPVPFFDEWEASLPFVMDVQDGVYQSWFAQFNEHRLVLTRLLLYPILVWLGGRVWLLNAVIFALILAGAWLFRRLYLAASPDATSTPDAQRLSAVVAGWLFLWSQRETLAWGFNVAFINAMVLMTLALYLLTREQDGPGPRARVLAALVGVAAAGSMANGVLVLPSLAVLAWWRRLGWRTTLSFTLLATTVIALYFHGYTAPVDRHGSITETLLTQPSAVAQFVALFLGSPFRWLFGSSLVAPAVGAVAGFAYIGLWLWFGWRVVRHRDTAARLLPLWIFASYVLATATITGLGRAAVFGPESALWSRYTTAAVWGWAALFSLLHVDVSLWPRARRWAAAACLCALAILMTARQANGDETGGLFTRSREVPALAGAMHVRDVAVLQRVSSSPTLVLEVSARAQLHHLSVFQSDPFLGLVGQLGHPGGPLPEDLCLGAITGAQTIEDEAMVRVWGWLIGRGSHEPGQHVIRVLRDGVIVGFAIYGQAVPDRTVQHADEGTIGFTGYAPLSSMGGPLTLVSDGSACRTDVMAPPLSR